MITIMCQVAVPRIRSSNTRLRSSLWQHFTVLHQHSNSATLSVQLDDQWRPAGKVWSREQVEVGREASFVKYLCPWSNAHNEQPNTVFVNKYGRKGKQHGLWNVKLDIQSQTKQRPWPLLYFTPFLTDHFDHLWSYWDCCPCCSIPILNKQAIFPFRK